MITLGVSQIKNWKTLFLLSIILPVGLLTTLKITGMIKEPLTIAETLEMAPVVWKCERPRITSNVPGDIIKVNYSDNEVSLTEFLELGEYDDGSGFWSWQGTGGPTIYIGAQELTVSVKSGFVDRLKFELSEGYSASSAAFHESGGRSGSNLTMEKMADRLRNPQMLDANTKAFLSMVRVGNPNRVSMSEISETSALYSLESPYNYTHQISITIEVVYFNGTVYKKLVQPVLFVFVPDNNNSFETAEEINFGTREAYLDDMAEGDMVDYYKIWLEQGQDVEFALIDPLIQRDAIGLEMSIYNPEKQLEVSLLYPENSTRKTTLEANQTGWWYIKIDYVIGLYIYRLDVLETDLEET